MLNARAVMSLLDSVEAALDTLPPGDPPGPDTVLTVRIADGVQGSPPYSVGVSVRAVDDITGPTLPGDMDMKGDSN